MVIEVDVLKAVTLSRISMLILLVLLVQISLHLSALRDFYISVAVNNI